MITFATLSQKPGAFRSLTGMSPQEFEPLFADWAEADRSRRAREGVTRRTKRERLRAPGAGRKYELDGRTRLLMALVWLKVYPTWEVLGYFFGLDESNARKGSKDVLKTLEAMGSFPLERRPRKQGRSLEEVIEAVPEVAVLIDSKEQRIRRPSGGWQAQKPYYSGKKKAHTMKTQVAADLEGQVLAVRESVPGPGSDITLLRESGVVEQLEADEAVAADRGYIGIDKDYPTVDFYLPFKRKNKQPLTEAERAFNRALASVRVKIEHLFGRMNRYDACAAVFRQRRQLHSCVVRVVALLVDRQRAMGMGAVCPVAA
jgi:hypothetical protein